jgi:hypothetical protein
MREIGQPINSESVQKLQMALHAKAKAEAGDRFYVLYDKISREDILAHAWAQCRSTRARRARTVTTSRMSMRTACSGGSANWRLRSGRKPYRPDPMTGVADASGQHVAVQAGHVHVEDGEVERLRLE